MKRNTDTQRVFPKEDSYLRSLLKGKKIAILDDDFIVLKMFLHYFDDVKGDIFVSTNNLEFIEFVKRYQPDLLILDYYLENNSTCSDVYNEINKGREKDYPAIIISGFFEKAMVYNYNYSSIYRKYLAKPFDYNELTRILEYFFNKKKDTSKIKLPATINKFRKK
jgi:DNA-binding NtrC family response regulator